MIIKFPIKTVSEANQREHWTKRLKRKNAQQKAFQAIWRNSKAVVNLPAVIIFTRYACNVMDSDNLAGAFKALRDQLAREIGIDDGSDQIAFVYEQKRIDKREHYFTVELREV